MERICKDRSHRVHLRKTGEECTCPKYVPAQDYDALAAHVELLCQRWSEFLDSGDEKDGAAFRMQEAVESSPTASPARLDDSFQSRVHPWLIECFGTEIAGNTTERNHRFLEEALELVQACGCTSDEARRLVDYVFGRDVGERSQEVGGVMVTLAALCLAQKLDMQALGNKELTRISQPATVERIREKQKRKPAMSPLPGVYPDRRQAEGGE